MSSINQTFSRAEDLDSLLMHAAQEKAHKQRERVLSGELRMPSKSVETLGRESALKWVAEDPEVVIVKLGEQRKILAEEFTYTDPKEADEQRGRRQRQRNFAKGAVKMLESYLNEQGIHIPTQEEREAEAISRILEMESATL